ASTDYAGILAEGEVLAKIADNVVVKLPLTMDGVRATRQLSGRGIKTNVTLCFSPNQALLAAKVGATYISPFIGRLDDINADGIELVEEIRQIYVNDAFTSDTLAAWAPTRTRITEGALAGADGGTIPPAVIYQLAD